MKNFDMSEFACRCCGRLPPSARKNIEALVTEVLEPVRQELGRAVSVNSGYRCPGHNAAVGGVPGSLHLSGEAADLQAGGGTEALARAIEARGKYDQLIRYLNPDGSTRFVHVSWRRVGGNRKQKFEKHIRQER